MALLTSEKIEEIELLCRDIISDAYCSDPVIPPVNLSKIIQQVGISVKLGNFDEINIDGAYERSSKTIFISKDAPYVRQAFTAAHELGHYFLHTNKDVEIFYRNAFLDSENIVDPKIKQEEQEANCFAASLLMPRSLIMRFWPALKSVEAIAYRFNVSSIAAFWRLRNLGLV